MRRTLICKAINRNMGEIGWDNDDWLFTEYKIYSNRTIKRTTSFCKTEKNEKKIYRISKMRYSTILNYMQNKFKKFDEVIDADDGDDWVIEYFDNNGNLVKKYEGYIYESILEDIAILFEPSKNYIVLKILITIVKLKRIFNKYKKLFL